MASLLSNPLHTREYGVAPHTQSDQRSRRLAMSMQVDLSRCIGSGQGSALAPSVFDVGEMGHVVLLDTGPGGDDLEGAREAVRSCPTGTLQLG
jgi:ferredoxin